jgi:hypothetical protein
VADYEKEKSHSEFIFLSLVPRFNCGVSLLRSGKDMKTSFLSFSSRLSRDLAQPAFTFAPNNQVLRKSQSGLQDISHFKKKQDEQVRFDDK